MNKYLTYLIMLSLPLLTACEPGLSFHNVQRNTNGYTMPTASDGTYLYVVDNRYQIIDRITIADGTRVSPWIGIAGSATSATGALGVGSFKSIRGIAYDPVTTSLYITDEAYVRQISNLTTPNILAYVGTGTTAITDGTGAGAAVSQPTAISVVGTNLIFSDNGGITLRNIGIASKVVTTLSNNGSGNVDGNYAAAMTGIIKGMHVIGTDIYATDTTYNVIRKIDTTGLGNITVFAGTAGAAHDFADANGTSAKFAQPAGITSNGADYLFVADTRNRAIRKIQIASPYAVSTIFGGPTKGADVDGPVDTTAKTMSPLGVYYTTSGLYFINSFAVRRLN